MAFVLNIYDDLDDGLGNSGFKIKSKYNTYVLYFDLILNI